MFPVKGVHKYVAAYIRSLPDLTGKKVLDIPCGDGRSSYEFKQKGAEVIALDLFPEFMKLDDVDASYADLSDRLPVQEGSVDYIICQEGIEHIPDQLKVLQEFNRVLKKDGILLITTPNYSHMRARLSHFFFETDYWKRMPPSEIDSIWFSSKDSEKLYFGHLFLVGVQHLQSLTTLSGFVISRRIKTDLGSTSLILGVLLYPFLTLFSLLTFNHYKDKNKAVDSNVAKERFWSRLKLNLSPTTLFYKHTFWVVRKTNNVPEMIDELKLLQKSQI